MIPESGRSMIEIHLNIARTTTLDDYAEDSLKYAEGMFSYACAVGHLSPAQYHTELVTTQLIRAQRKNSSVTNH
ncbi:hypothetical protein D9M71_778180 [compost metagenome]